MTPQELETALRVFHSKFTTSKENRIYKVFYQFRRFNIEVYIGSDFIGRQCYKTTRNAIRRMFEIAPVEQWRILE